VSPHGTEIVKLNELQFAPSSEEGVSVAYQGPKDGRLINGGWKARQLDIPRPSGFILFPCYW